MKQATKKRLYIAAVACGLLLCLVYSFSTDNSHKATLEKQFDPYTGEHVALRERIKFYMHNPASYKHIQTTYSDLDSFIIVKTQYYGTNAYGGQVKETVEARIDATGENITIVGNDDATTNTAKARVL